VTVSQAVAREWRGPESDFRRVVEAVRRVMFLRDAGGSGPEPDIRHVISGPTEHRHTGFACLCHWTGPGDAIQAHGDDVRGPAQGRATDTAMRRARVRLPKPA
jgi:hypothetical protein